ncbi:hypothetical protein QBC40DRAFT_100607 [Triangularia verruculosa]|uniref:Uncharacterized protein n=1 Tax=Triangularia verruculosa TaxID=2587418 RepID=A0AAN7AT84_9PEZI|nr:hypothetical protein QBC40DRAFT_100607 [Triangularia verruculosa]
MTTAARSVAAVTAATTTAAEPLDVVETPTSPSSGLALSRFEFETGKGNEGTKVLMVEWDASVTGEEQGESKTREAGKGADGANDWEISWEGKPSALAVQDIDGGVGVSGSSGGSTRRTYFLLPTGAPVPALVNITRKGGLDGPVLRTMPMPAIFPAELTGKQEAGLRGVLHTIWAKKRLAELQAEIEVEMSTNGESVGLEMAAQERQWIVDHFGLGPDHGAPKPTRLHIPQTTAGPASPRSPIGGKLGEKLRGLKLATSPAELAAATQASKDTQRRAQSALATSSTAASDAANQAGRGLALGSAGAGVASLDAVIGNSLPQSSSAAGKPGAEDTTEEDLFALPMSPRSPEMKRSPFSIL